VQINIVYKFRFTHRAVASIDQSNQIVNGQIKSR